MSSKKSQTILSIGPDSTYADIVTYQKGRFRTLQKEPCLEIQKHFKAFDLDHSGHLDVHEVTKMYEKLGEPKTASQVKKLIAELDKNNDGKVSFEEFLNLWCGPETNLKKDEPVTTSQELKGRIAKVCYIFTQYQFHFC